MNLSYNNKRTINFNIPTNKTYNLINKTFNKINNINIWNENSLYLYNKSFVNNYINLKQNKKALFIGINYKNTQYELNGCINDVKNISTLLNNRYGFNNIMILTDDQNNINKQPTYKNIINAIKWLTKDALPGDSLFFHYSGHGGSIIDKNNDEIDGYDETIIPLDFERKGQITDEELFKYLVKPLPKGCKLTTLFDSCHSGTILDLPYLYKYDNNIKFTKTSTIKKAFKYIVNLVDQNNINRLKNDLLIYHKINETTSKINLKGKLILADVIQFSGCSDKQYSADTYINNKYTGAMSYAFIKTLNDNKSLTYKDLLLNLRLFMKKNNYKQIPQLATSRPLNINDKFII